MYTVLVLIFVIIFFGCVNIYKSCKTLENQANRNFTYIADEIQNKENDYFKKAEDEVVHCKDLVELTINEEKLIKIAPIAYKYKETEIPYVTNYLNKIVSPLLLRSTTYVPGLMGIYFDLDHDLIKHKDIIGIWYTDTESNGKFKITDNGATSTMFPENRPELEWFYLPKKIKRGVWGKAYMDDDLKINTVTYSTPVYSGKTFIGIMGVDVSMNEIKKQIYNLKIYETGKAYLIDQDKKIIFAKSYKPFTSIEVVDKNLYNYLSKVGIKNEINLTNGEVKLIKSSSSQKLFAVTSIYNGFIIVLEVPLKELYAETHNLITRTTYSLLLVVFICLLIAIKAYMQMKKINDELIHKEKLISMGTMAAEVAHEINNPVGFINCNIDTLKKFIEKIKNFVICYEAGLKNVLDKKSTIEEEIDRINNLKEKLKIDYVMSSLGELIDESKEGIQRVSEIVFNLKSYAEDDQLNIKFQESLEKIILDALAVLSNKIKSDIEITNIFGDIPPLYCNKNQLVQVLVNLIDNACYSVAKKGHSDKKISITTYKKDKNAYIEIEDNGVGIEKNKINKIFDSFFTTKAHGEGTGLGLSIVYEIITNKHNGEISVESKKDQGSKFTIKIPY